MAALYTSSAVFHFYFEVKKICTAVVRAWQIKIFLYPTGSPSCVPHILKASLLYRKRHITGKCANFYATVTSLILSDDSQLLFSSLLLSLTGPEAGMLLVTSSPSGCCTENPLQALCRILEMNDSSQMWSMKWSLLVFVYIKTPFMSDDSEP